MCKFLDFMDSPSHTYMKWPLAVKNVVCYLKIKRIVIYIQNVKKARGKKIKNAIEFEWMLQLLIVITGSHFSCQIQFQFGSARVSGYRTVQLLLGSNEILVNLKQKAFLKDSFKRPNFIRLTYDIYFQIQPAACR